MLKHLALGGHAGGQQGIVNANVDDFAVVNVIFVKSLLFKLHYTTSNIIIIINKERTEIYATHYRTY